MSEVKLGDVSFITKLAGFEHTKYIQGNNTHEKISEDDVPLFIGKTVQNGKIDRNFDWYIPKQISDQLERSKLNKKCLVLPYVGSVGDLAIFDATYDAHLGSNIAKIELACNSGYSEEFIYYFLKSDYGQKVLLRDIQGAIQKNITMKAIRDVSLPDISTQEQDKIVSILKSLDDKIDNNNQINQELEVMAKTLYDYWFVQFDFPDQNGKPYKSSGGKMVYNPELKREIPDGWGVEKLKDFSQYVSEKVDSSELNIENYVGTDNMIADMGGIELTTSIPKSGTSTKFSVGDILISNIRPYFKKIWLSDRIGGCSADVLCIRTKKIISKEFVYATLARDDFFNYDIAGSKGSKMPRGDKKHIMEYPIVFELGIVEQYSKIVRPIYEAVHENNNQNQELTRLRDWLLPMLMNGQVYKRIEGKND